MANDLFSFEQMIEKALTTDDGLSKMRELIAMQKEGIGDDARRAFFAAKSQMQAALPVIKRMKHNQANNSYYASLDDVALQITPVLERFGFSFAWDQTFDHSNGMITVTCILTHVDGHEERNSIDAIADTNGPKGQANKTPVQGTGSTITFLRRYTLTGVVGVATADKDIDGRIPNITERQKQLSGVTNSDTLNALAAPTMTKSIVDEMLTASTSLAELNDAGKHINVLPAEEQHDLKTLYYSMRDQFKEAMANEVSQ